MKRNDRRLARRKTPAHGNEPTAPADDSDDERELAADEVLDWRIVRGRGRPIAHAVRQGDRRVLCGTAFVDASLPSPPSHERCPTCTALVTKSRNKETHHAPSES